MSLNAKPSPGEMRMKISHGSYIAKETAINTVISMVFSMLFALLFFRAHSDIDLGSRAVVLDMAPQGFAVALMSFLIPTLLTRKRRRDGALPARAGTHRLPRNALLRGALAGAIAAAVCTAGYAMLGPAPGAIIEPLNHFIMLKAVFGAMLSLMLTPIALDAALKDPV